MLRVTVEIVPFGSEDGAKKLGTMIIGNVTPFNDPSSYHVWVDEDPRKNPRPKPHAEVMDHIRSKGFWELVRRSLNEIERVKNG